ncbi:MAG: ferritin-like domain-containing protein [Terriglobales bacterium]
MNGAAFVEQLKAQNEVLLRKLDADPGSQAAELGPLLKMALKNEAEAAEVAALWVATTPELEAKLALACHAGDEARHYELLAAAAREQGVDLAGFDPLNPPSPVLEYLRTLETTVERVAAALVTREAMGARRNAQFLKVLEAGGHKSLAALYRDVINPDEERHHQSGCELLARLADSPEAQERARLAARRLLEIGDRVRTTVMEKTGAACVPGC